MRDERDYRDERERYYEKPERLEEIDTLYQPPSREESRWLFDYRELYWEIKARLMGGYVTQDVQGNYKIIRSKDAEPMLNTRGIEETMSLLNAFVTKIQGVTYLDEERIFELCRDIYVKLAKLYYIQMENYNINPSKASVVIRFVMNNIESNMRKSIGGRSMQMIGQTERIVETRNEPKRRFWLF